MIRTDGERGRARQEVRAGGITGSVGICAGHTTWPTDPSRNNTIAVICGQSTQIVPICEQLYPVGHKANFLMFPTQVQMNRQPFNTKTWHKLIVNRIEMKNRQN